MARSTFVPLRDVGDDLVRVQARIADALDKLAAAIPASPTRFYSTLTLGRNGAGYIALGPHKDVANNILSRPVAGDRVLVAWNVTAGQDMLFARYVENFVSKTDQLRQLQATNISAQTLLIVTAGS